MPERGTLLWWRDALLAWGGAAAIMGAGLFLLKGDLSASPGGRILAGVGFAALAMGWGVWFAVRIVRRSDEFHMESSKFAWHWGGLAGLVVSAVAYVFVMMGGLHWLNPAAPAGRDLANAFAQGYGLAIVSQLIGFIVVFIWWKASKR